MWGLAPYGTHLDRDCQDRDTNTSSTDPREYTSKNEKVNRWRYTTEKRAKLKDGYRSHVDP